MKKIYFLLLFVLLGIVANAQETTLSSSFTGYKDGNFLTSENELTWKLDKTLGYVGYQAGKGIQFGSSSNPAKEYTFQVNEEIENVLKVEVSVCVAKGGEASISVFVGENQLGDVQSFSSTSLETLTFEGGPSTGKISLNMNGIVKAHYINKVVVYYSEGGSIKTSTPTFSLAEGTYSDIQIVELSCATENSTIIYKINEGPENTYSESIQLLENGTYMISAWANADGLEQSEVATVTYTIEKKCSEPKFSLKAGSYIVAQTLELVSETSDAQIKYAINDGDVQTYSSPIVFDENGTFTVKAWAEKEGYANSSEVVREYVFDIVEGLEVEDFDFVSIGETNGYPTGVDGTDGQTLEFSSGNIMVSTVPGSTTNRFWNNWTEYRMYTGASLTFSVLGNYTIVRIELIASKSNVSGEGYSDGVWTGESQSVTLNINGSTTFTDFIVYYKPIALDQVATPAFSLASGLYEDDQELTLSCATEGATIFYTVNEGETLTYSETEKIKLTTEIGSYEIKAWAVKEGMTQSSEVKANYTIVKPLVATTIAEFKTLGVIAENKDRFITLNCPLIVTYQNGGEGTRDLYVKDEEGNALLIYDYNNPEFNVGDVIPAGLKGKYKDFNGIIELINPENFGKVEETITVEPELKTVNDIKDSDVNKLVLINNVTLTELENKNGTLADATGSIVVRDNSYVTYPSDFEKTYNVTAIVAKYNTTIQLYPVAFETVLEQVAVPVFSLTEETYEGEQSLELTCATDGATIHYSINGEEEKIYSEEIDLTIGEYEIVAWATKEGMADSEKVAKSYNITEPVSVSYVKSENVHVYGGSNAVMIVTENDSMVSVYNMVGELVKNTTVVKGETSVSLTSGIYLVKVDGCVVKVVVE